jgi:hypothetical protein
MEIQIDRATRILPCPRKIDKIIWNKTDISCEEQIPADTQFLKVFLREYL